MSSLNQSILTNKHILFDTCFVIKRYQYAKTFYFNKFFEVLKNNNCIPVINDFIKFEFMRGCKKKEHTTDKQNYLNFFSQISLPGRLDELTKTAVTISNIYSNKIILKFLLKKLRQNKCRSMELAELKKRKCYLIVILLVIASKFFGVF